MFGELLDVEEQAGSRAQEFESCFFKIRNLFSFDKDGSSAFPLSLNHTCEFLKAYLLH
jgi:hypothetical protein